MADNTSYMLKASAVLKGACGDLKTAGTTALDAAAEIKRTAQYNLAAAKGHVQTAQQITDAVTAIQANPDAVTELLGSEAGLTLDSVVTSLNGIASAALAGILSMIPTELPSLPVILEVPPLLDTEDLQSLKDYVVTEDSPYAPPTSDQAPPSIPPLLAPSSTVEAPADPTPATAGAVMGIVNRTGLDFADGLYPTGEILRPKRFDLTQFLP